MPCRTLLPSWFMYESYTKFTLGAYLFTGTRRLSMTLYSMYPALGTSVAELNRKLSKLCIFHWWLLSNGSMIPQQPFTWAWRWRRSSLTIIHPLWQISSFVSHLCDKCLLLHVCQPRPRHDQTQRSTVCSTEMSSCLLTLVSGCQSWGMFAVMELVDQRIPEGTKYFCSGSIYSPALWSWFTCADLQKKKY